MAGGSRTDALFNVAIAGALLYVLSLPSSPARQAFERWSAERQAATLIDASWETLQATTSRLGPGSEDLVLIKFSDYECPFCAEAHRLAAAFLESSPGTAIGVRHFPLDFHERAEAAALTAICAEFQGRFRQAHTLLFDVINYDDEPDWESLGSQIGVPDLQEFADCLSGRAARERLEQDKALAEALGLKATPSFVSRKKIVPGVPGGADSFSAMAREAAGGGN